MACSTSFIIASCGRFSILPRSLPSPDCLIPPPLHCSARHRLLVRQVKRRVGSSLSPQRQKNNPPKHVFGDVLNKEPASAWETVDPSLHGNLRSAPHLSDQPQAGLPSASEARPRLSTPPDPGRSDSSYLSSSPRHKRSVLSGTVTKQPAPVPLQYKAPRPSSTFVNVHESLLEQVEAAEGLKESFIVARSHSVSQPGWVQRLTQ